MLRTLCAILSASHKGEAARQTAEYGASYLLACLPFLQEEGRVCPRRGGMLAKEERLGGAKGILKGAPLSRFLFHISLAAQRNMAGFGRVAQKTKRKTGFGRAAQKMKRKVRFGRAAQKTKRKTGFGRAAHINIYLKERG